MKITITNWGMLYDFASGIDMCRALYTIDNHNVQKHLAIKKVDSKKPMTAQEAVIIELKNMYGSDIEIVFDEKQAKVVG